MKAGVLVLGGSVFHWCANVALGKVVYGYDSYMAKKGTGGASGRAVFSDTVNGSLESNAQILNGCSYSLEIMHVQDASTSFEDDIASLANQMDNFFTELELRYPGSKVGMSSFVDKPMDPVWKNDRCFTNLAPIGSSVEDVISALRSAKAQGGLDTAENSMGGMARAALSAKSNWTDRGQTHDENGRPIVRLMILATDAFSHWAPDFGRDWLLANGYDKGYDRSNMSFSEVADILREGIEDENIHCVNGEYPTIDEWANVLRERNIIPLILAGDWTFEVDGTLYYDRVFRDLAKQFGEKSWEPVDRGLENYWASMLEWGGLQGMVTSVDSSMDDFMNKVLSELTESLPSLVCRDVIATTTAPVDDTNEGNAATHKKEQLTAMVTGDIPHFVSMEVGEGASAGTATEDNTATDNDVANTTNVVTEYTAGTRSSTGGVSTIVVAPLPTLSAHDPSTTGNEKDLKTDTAPVRPSKVTNPFLERTTTKAGSQKETEAAPEDVVTGKEGCNRQPCESCIKEINAEIQVVIH